MFKKIIAGVLIVLASATWGYLDYLNKQELKAAEELRISIEQSRAQALARARAAAEAKARFESTLLADLTTCKAEAERMKAEFLFQNQKPVRRKPGQFTVSQAVTDEADQKLEAANTACQAAYDARLQRGS